MRICKKCQKQFPPDHSEQEICKDCDPWQGYKLCDGNGCFELFVPTKAQRQSVSYQRRPMWFCPRCRSSP